jgi:hypothetical protein
MSWSSSTSAVMVRSSLRCEMGRVSDAMPTTRQVLPDRSSIRSTTPRCEPQKPPIVAGLPWIVPAAASTPAMPSKSGPGKTRCWCPVRTASMPSTMASGTEAFSIPSVQSAAPMPEWLSAMTMSAPSSFICGTQACAASTMSRAVTLPSRCLRSQFMICGGTKPITPMRIGCAFARAVGERAVEDDVRRHEGRVGGRRGARGLHDVGRDDREGRAGERVLEEREPVVEFVVAERRGLHPQRVEGGDDRVHVARRHPAFVGDEVAHRVALQEIPVVEEDGVRGLGPDVRHMGGGARQAQRVDRAVGVVVVGPDVDVDVGRLHHPQMRLVGLRMGGERVEEGEARAGGRGPEEGAAGHGGGATVQHGGSLWCFEVSQSVA